MGSPCRRTHIDKKKRDFGKSALIIFLKKGKTKMLTSVLLAATNNTILDIGPQDQVCKFCGAFVWAVEFTGTHVGTGPKAYSICCAKGKVQLPLLKETPPELKQLLTSTIMREINVNESINNGSGLYVFRVNDHVYHSIGSLVPPDGRTPKFAQFYMYDGQEPLSEQTPVRLRLLERSTDGRFVNLIGRNDYEFAGLAVDNNLVNRRDIVVEYKRGGLQRITGIHLCFMSLQYPLLFTHREDGYILGIKHRNVNNANQDNDKTVSMREIQAFRLQCRASEGHTLLLGGRLFLQYVVDSWHGDVSATEVGKRIVLPSNFTGGFRYMQQNFQNSLAICKEYGHPDLFVTFTCNLKWVEIQRALVAAGSTTASVRPDFVARVFKLKLDAMMSDFMKKDVVAVYTIEFQKCGLPHAYIVLWLAEGDKLVFTEDIDHIISAKLPDKENDHVGYQVVSQFIMHDPYGESDYIFNLFHGHVVPYNRGLLVKYQAHINVERCNRSQSIKYLFKYIGKGPDKVIAVMERTDSRYNGPTVAAYTSQEVYAHPASGERFYLRLLLNVIVGAKTFDEIRTVDGIVYPINKEACFHRGLLESDKEWHVALDDASHYATSPQLRELFVTRLIFYEVSNPAELWEKHRNTLADDIQYTQRRLLQLPTLVINDHDKQALALEGINNLLKQHGKTLTDFPELPQLDTAVTYKYGNQLLLEELMYDCHALQIEATKRTTYLNQMQRLIFDKVIQSVALNSGDFYFIYGHGGTGKTFLWSTILCKLRSEGLIVLAVASSGIASLLIECGRTTHSRVRIPTDINEVSTCEIKKNTHIAELICKTSLIIWDEALMTHCYVYEAVDRSFRKIRRTVNPNADPLPFGGITMLMGGDFRKTLHVVLGSRRYCGCKYKQILSLARMQGIHAHRKYACRAKCTFGIN
ncbi:uncharacterized protein LOC141665980 [Apium graveolens]|uniref:uncharacterized protein LOC141665980 n=1 Tax=Apium graveolens TaxID=4045 RepID=UPI003D7A52B3